MSAPRPRIDFRTLFELEVDYVRRTLRSLGVNPNDLDDAALDVFVAVHAHLGDYDDERPMKPWLFGFAVRVASTFRRRAHVWREVTDDSIDAVDDAGGPDEALDAKQARALVDHALQALEDDRRDLFVAHELEGIAVPELAAVLGIPVNTAYSRLRAAREEFARAIERIRKRSLKPSAGAERRSNEHEGGEA